MVPFDILHRVGLDEAVLVHNLCVHRNRPGIGDDGAVVVHRTLGQGDLHAHAAAVRPFAQQHVLAGREANGAAGRVDVAVIFNVVGDEKRGAAIADLDLAVIDDAGQRRRAVELPDCRRYFAAGGNLRWKR